jgi:uncharacterized membrane protein YhaH (DUF805 family)
MSLQLGQSIGRIRGSAYWSLIALFFGIRLAFVILLAQRAIPTHVATYADFFLLLGLMFVLVARFHDFGFAAYHAFAWLLGCIVVPSIAFLYVFGPASPWPLLNTFGHIPGGLPPYVGSVGYAAAFLLSVVVGPIKGESGPNSYGQEPPGNSTAHLWRLPQK